MAYDDDDFDPDLVKRLRAEIKERDKRLAEMDTELGQLRGRDQQRTIADVFGARGVDPRFARLAKAEVDEVSEESLLAWIEANADLVGVQAAPSQEQQAPMTDPYRRMAAVEQMAQPGIPGDALSRVESAETEEEVWAALGVGRTFI